MQLLKEQMEKSQGIGAKFPLFQHQSVPVSTQSLACSITIPQQATFLAAGPEVPACSSTHSCIGFDRQKKDMTQHFLQQTWAAVFARNLLPMGRQRRCPKLEVMGLTFSCSQHPLLQLKAAARAEAWAPAGCRGGETPLSILSAI